MPTPRMWCVCLNPTIEVVLIIPEGEFASHLTTASEFAVAAGGKCVNVARLFRQLGLAYGNVRLLRLDVLRPSPLSRLFNELLAEPPLAEIVVPALSELRVSIVQTELNSERACITRTSGKLDVSAQDRLVDDLVVRLGDVGPDDWLICSGSLPTGARQDTYYSLCCFAHDKGAMTAVDCSGDALYHALSARPTLVKVNYEEALGTLGLSPEVGRITPERRPPVGELAARLHARGAGLAIVTDGARPLGWVSEEKRGAFEPPPRPVRAANGAGDAFLAAFLTSLCCHHGHKELYDHVRYASRIAGDALATMSAGELPSVAERGEDLT